MSSPTGPLSIPLFDGMTAEDAEVFSRLGEQKTIPAGGSLLYQRMEATEMYYVVKGEVTVKVMDENDIPTMVRVIGPGKLAGWSALIPPHQATATLMALTDVDVICFDGSKLRQLLRQHPDAGVSLMLNIARLISDRLAESRKSLASCFKPR